jgi:hypothetical protein
MLSRAGQMTLRRFGLSDIPALVLSGLHHVVGRHARIMRYLSVRYGFLPVSLWRELPARLVNPLLDARHQPPLEEHELAHSVHHRNSSKAASKALVLKFRLHATKPIL